MSHTNKDDKNYQVRKMLKRGSEDYPFISYAPQSTDEYETTRKFNELVETSTDGWRMEHEHSAAHRHSAKKTRKRVSRRKKHSENQDVAKQIEADQIKD